MARKDLGRSDIELTLVMKYALPEDVSAEQQSGLDLPPRNLWSLKVKYRDLRPLKENE